MRWFWIDRFLEFESGRRAVAVKNVSLSEDYHSEWLLAMPLMPGSLILEGLAQTGGLLVGETSGFRDRVILAKFGRVVFHDSARPGDQLVYEAEVQDIKPTGSIVFTTARLEQRLLAEVEIVFAHLDDRFAGVELFDPAMFLGNLRSYGLFDVGKNADGSPLQVPSYMLAAENRLAAADPRAYEEPGYAVS